VRQLPTAAQARPGIDPRIRKRRIEVARMEGRRRLRVLLAVAGAFLAISAAVAFLHSPAARVHRVVLEGAVHTPLGAVEQASGLEAHPLMVDLDTAAVARRVRALPWVATASVRRDWPSTVVVRLTERRPVAQAPARGGGWVLVDRGGRVLARGARPWPSQPELAGLAPAPGPGGRVLGASAQLDLAARLPGWLRPQVRQVGRGPQGLELGLGLPARVELGDSSQLGAKFSALATLLAQAPQPGGTYDLTVPSAPALTR
jgi:cell division protein FtsQ